MDADKSVIDLSNLNQVFLKHDDDHDGKVNAQQTLNIFNQMGYNDLYLGSVKKILRLLNYREYPNQSEQIDFTQLEEYMEAKETEGKFQLWKAKLQVLQAIAEGQKQLFGQENNQQAAPGSNANQNDFGPKNSQQGQISIKIGQGNNYNQRIYAMLQKMPCQEVKPFARISIDRPSQQSAKKTQQLFKKLNETVIQILKNESPEYISQIESVKFITNTNGSTFNLFITTSNTYILDLLNVCGQFIDRILKDALKAKISLQYLFNFDINKFLSDQNSSFYSLLTKNCQLNVKWNVFQIFKAFRQIAFKSQALGDLQYNKSDEFSNFLIGLLHLQEFTGKLQFQNVIVGQNAVEQLQSKYQLSKILNQLKEQIQSVESQGSMDIMGLIKQLDGKIKMQVMLGQWKLNGEVQVKDLPKLFTQNMQVIDPYN